MRIVRTGAAALCLAAVTAACSNGDTGSAGGWRVTGTHISLSGAATACRTSSPVVDTFSATPTPQPGCSPSASLRVGAVEASPSPGAMQPQRWQAVRPVQQYRADNVQWKPIYSTYTAPPGTGIYQPMVQVTNQPMPTPFTSTAPLPTTAPKLVLPSATP